VWAFDSDTVIQQNTHTGFLSYHSLEKINPYTLQTPPTKKLDIVDWEALEKIPDRSIESCSEVSTASKSWKFLQAHKRPETDVLVVSRWNKSYPCQYMAKHLDRHGFAMAALEDVPIPIAQKFRSKYLVFFREGSFYKSYFHKPEKTIAYLRHEEMHLIQALHNPLLEKYMWHQGKENITEFGAFIEGCTEFHFPTGGPGYRSHVETYKKLLDQALKNDQKFLLDRACSGDYDAFLTL